MKRSVLIISMFLSVVVNAKAQWSIIDTGNDSLRYYFQKEKPYEVYDYYSTAYRLQFNYKELYNDKELKGDLLKWLDSAEIINYDISSYKKMFLAQYDYNENQKTAFIKDYIVRVLKLNYDSVKAVTPSLNIYMDSAASIYIERYKSDLLKNNVLLPPYEAMRFLSKIAYPEVYKKIKDWWYQAGEPTFTKNQMDGLFSCMLMMNDPEAQAIFDRVIKKVIEMDGSMIQDKSFVSQIQGINNAYAVKKLVEILPLQNNIEGMAGDPLLPMDNFTYSVLKNIFLRNNMSVEAYRIQPTKPNKFVTDEEYIEHMRQHKSEIVQEATELIKKLETEEQYWVKNMPYNYVPDTTKVK